MDPVQDKVTESLLKTISRISMLAEGNDPELDVTLQKIRGSLSRSQTPEVINSSLQTLEPLILKYDEERLARAQTFRAKLLELVDMVDDLPTTQMLPQAKRTLEADIRKHWQTSSQWPELLAKTIQLVSNTFKERPTENTNNGQNCLPSTRSIRP